MTPPSRLYRYRPLAGGFAIRELDALRDAYLWSPRFTEMNDPMEAFYELGGPGDGLIDGLLRPAGRSAAELYAMAREAFDRFCLVSFSSSPDDLPLWAYYGDNFAGLCLEFATDRLFVGDFQGEELFPVTYADSPLPPLAFHEISGVDAITHRLSRKRIEWAHEKEWRILTGAGGRRHYIDEALIRIYLGPRIEEAHAKQILEIFADRPTEIVQGRIDGYTLTFETVQAARPADACGRVGTGTLNLDEVPYARDEIEAFLAAPIEDLIDELKRIAIQPNVDVVSGCDLSVNRPAIYVMIEQRLRNDHVVFERRYYDPDLVRLE